MASSKIRTITTVTLELSSKEAAWLRALLQNPVGGETEEYEWNRKLREAIFFALLTS